MNCPRCHAQVPFTKTFCDNCGQDLTVYRRVVSISNVCYNRGLEQAKARDLSGAISSLRKSLEFNKLNTNARNLLGLIYFEEGEIVSALSEWVISRHFQHRGNDADGYIEKVQADSNQLDMYNQTIRKYNGALYSAQNGDEDMAIIQLKKVVGMNPKFIRAGQLLALLYMMSGKQDQKVRAKRILLDLKKVDETNTTTIRYLKELSNVSVRGETKKIEPVRPEAEKQSAALPRVDADAYKQITPYKEEKPSIMPFVNIVIGVVIGLALMGFLIIPHMRSTNSEKSNADFKEYSESKASSESDVATLQNENEELNEQIEQLQSELDTLKSGGAEDGSGQTVYRTLLTAVQYYMEDDAVNAAKTLSQIDKQALEDDVALSMYNTIKDTTYEAASESYFLLGRDAYNGEGEYASGHDYDAAIKYLNRALKYDKENTDAMYFLGRCYQQQSENEEALSYYNRIVEEFPDSARVSEAQQRLRELGQ